MKSYQSKSVFQGEVWRIESKDPSSFAEVYLKNETGALKKMRIKVGRLLPDLASCGSKFIYSVMDEGHVRTVTIEPDVEANDTSRARLKSLVDKTRLEILLDKGR